MFRGQGLAWPRFSSLLGALVLAVVLAIGSHLSPVLGYLFALLALVMIIVALHMESVWPTQSRQEHGVVFALFWGTMLGVVVPFLVAAFLEGGVAAVVDIFAS
tara:strand:+ start:10174 stop:10482 length:309 start_codon:yes stop_codon:yes gene_type:complete